MTKVTIVGAGKYGSMTALRVAESDLASEVVMTDIIEGLPQGLALDINQSRYVEKYETKVIGTNDYSQTEGSEVVVITAGLPRKPGMSRMDLLSVNAAIVEEVTREIVKYSSNPKISDLLLPKVLLSGRSLSTEFLKTLANLSPIVRFTS